MNNINSFAQNINQTIKNQANQLALLSAILNAVTDNSTVVNYQYTDGDGNTVTYQLPSYESIVNRLQAVEKSLNALSTGEGTINLTDGTRRTVQISSVPKTPSQITGLTDPTTFTVDSNWFFESLMFPGAQVSIDLTNQIESSADRVKVTRIILAANNDASRTIWENDLSLNTYDYASLKTLLSNNNISYYEDEEIVELPLVSNTLAGSFQITLDPTTKNGDVWYYLDSISYSTISSDGVDLGLNNILSVGDMLLYDDSIFKITNVNQNDMSVVLSRVSGVQTPGVYSIFTIYTDPFASKTINVRFGAHEYDILYFKGITEAYNLQADTWSTPVKFSTDSLILEGTSGQSALSFASYYAQYIMDWGSQMIAETKEHKISAWNGQTPNTPTLNGDDLRVVQINTQINAAIDTTDAKNTASEIESVKSLISSLKSTIAAQKTDLQSAVNLYTYNSIQQLIATNTTDLNNLQTTYTTLVESFQTLVKENSAITTEPKYHIRGFFPIPEFKYQDEDNNIQEEIIGFDIAYRYIKEDNTATQLNTFTYTNTDGTEVTGTFTDWVVETGPLKTKVYDSDLGKYIWKAENVADGTETNINQIDIAINKGEQVEIKVRSISECGYPENPLRSEWSNSVIISFPSTLATSNEIADLITMVNDDALNISITNMLDSVGVTTHLDDTIPNTNSVNGMYFKHTADNIAYEETGTSSDGTTVTNSISLQDKISQLFTQIESNTAQALTNRTDVDSLLSTESEHYSETTNNINSLQNSTTDLSTHINTVENKIDTILDSNNYVSSQKFIVKNENDEEDVALSSLNQSELFLIDNHDGTNKDLTSLHVKYLYIHPDGATTSQRYSVADLITDVTTTVTEHTDLIKFINSSIDDISTKIIDIAYISDVDKVQDEINTINDVLTSYSLDSNNDIKATNVYANEVRLSGTGGRLLIFENETTQPASIEVEDVLISSNNRYLTTLIDTVDENSNSITTLTTDLTSLSDNVNSFAFKSTNSEWTIKAGSGDYTNLTTNDITTNTVTINGTVFKPMLTQTQSGMIAPAIFQEVTVYRSGSEVDDPITMSGLSTLLTELISEYEPQINKVSTMLVNDGLESTVLTTTVTASGAISSQTLTLSDSVKLSGASGTLEVRSTENNDTLLDINVNNVKYSGTTSQDLQALDDIVTSHVTTINDYTQYVQDLFIREEASYAVESVDIRKGYCTGLYVRNDTTDTEGIYIGLGNGNKELYVNCYENGTKNKDNEMTLNLGPNGSLVCKDVKVYPSGSSTPVNLVDQLLAAISSNSTISNTATTNASHINKLQEAVNSIISFLISKYGTDCPLSSVSW